MKFLLNGNILETENILRISELFAPSTKHFYDGEMGEGMHQDERDWEWNFCIYFINDRHRLKFSHYDKDKILPQYEEVKKLWLADQSKLKTITI